MEVLEVPDVSGFLEFSGTLNFHLQRYGGAFWRVCVGVRWREIGWEKSCFFGNCTEIGAFFVEIALNLVRFSRKLHWNGCVFRGNCTEFGAVLVI